MFPENETPQQAHGIPYGEPKEVPIGDVLDGKIPIVEQYDTLEEQRRKLVAQSTRIVEKEAQKNIPETVRYSPYPGFDPKNPDPCFAYSGILYRTVGTGKHNYLEPVQNRTFDDIACRYGAGNYLLRMPDATGVCMSFPISKELVARVRAERADMGEEIFDWPKTETPPVTPTQPQNDMSKMYELMMKQSQDTQAQFQALLLSALGKDTSASSKALSDAAQEGFKQGQSSMSEVVSVLKERIAGLEHEREELKAKIETLQIALGNLPDPESDNTETTEAPQPPKSAIGEIVEGVKAFAEITNSLKNNSPASPQIEDQNKKKEVHVLNSDNIKNLIVNSFNQNSPISEAAQKVYAVIGMMEKNAIKNFATDQITQWLVNNYLPGAQPKLIQYLKGIVEAMKGF